MTQRRIEPTGPSLALFQIIVTASSRFLIVLAVSTSGCLPFPTLDPQSPDIVGSVVDRRQPAIDIPVTLSYGSTCNDPVKYTRTDEQGRFHFSPSYDVRWFQVILEHRMYEWTVCFVIRDELVGTSGAAHYGLAGRSTTVLVRCEISDSAPCHQTASVYYPERSEYYRFDELIGRAFLGNP